MLLSYYLPFMLSVGILACHQIMHPALQILGKTNRDDVLYQNKALAYFTMFCVGAVAAPAMIVVIFMPYAHSVAIDTLVNKKA